MNEWSMSGIMHEPNFTEEDLIKLVYDETFDQSPRARMERFKRFISDRYRFDFDNQCMILSDDLCKSIGLELPMDASLMRDGIMSTPFIEGPIFYVARKPQAFYYDFGASI